MRVIDVTLSVSVPVFDTVNVCAKDDPIPTLPKARDTTDREMPGVPVAVPLRAMDDGLPPALWATDKEADRFPENPVGANVTVTV